MNLSTAISYKYPKFIADGTGQNTKESLTSSFEITCSTQLSEKSISSVIMPSSTTTFLTNTDGSLGSENASQNSNSQQGNGNDFITPKENGMISCTTQ